LATFFLVFAGTGAIIVNEETGGAVTHVAIALTFGLVVAAMIVTFGPVSGSHMNPAVTIALAAAGRFPSARIPVYIAAQVLGAVAASALLSVLFPANEWLGATMPRGGAWRSFAFEAVLTFFLMMTILSILGRPQADSGGVFGAGVVIGAVVGLEAMFAGPISGASMNPARSFGPALVSGHMTDLWIYLAAPTVGAMAAAAVGGVLWRPRVGYLREE
jgi:aquaporin Z